MPVVLFLFLVLLAYFIALELLGLLRSDRPPPGLYMKLFLSPYQLAGGCFRGLNMN